ncbi:MAG TPA: hypothetical protein VKF40_19485 [Burkholderiales bacterium]|nr:hypothetical protein [Burkholderiales bacterium]
MLGVLIALIGLVLAFNLLLGERAMGSPGIVKAASDWQQATHGVTYPPPMTINRPFKILRLHDRLPEVNGVVFGASSAMGLTAGVFPESIRIYNFAQTGNPLQAAIPEAEYVVRNYSAHVRWLFIPIDWALGMLYAPGEPGAIDLSPRAALAPAALAHVSLATSLQDALSWPRVRNLGTLLLGVWRSGDRIQAFRQTFFEIASADYRCPDGTLARDFDTINRGICAGFRFDGSATFTDGKPVDATRGVQLARAAAAPSSKYSRALAITGGEPNPALLARLAALSAESSRKGGRLVLFLPPLIPGLERELAGSVHSGPAVRRTKAVLREWAVRTGLVVIDAGASERFGCSAGEFLDEHHAYPECYRKVLARFWGEHAVGTIRPGLWPSPDA